MTVTTDPPGAQVLVKDYAAPDTLMSLSVYAPLEKVSVPIGYKHWKIVKDGFEIVEGAGHDLSDRRAVTPRLEVPPPRSSSTSRLPPRRDGPGPGDSEFAPASAVSGKLPALKLSDFFLDKFEVTNHQYKKFVDDGGYKRPEFWKEKFIRDGKEIPWEEAMKSFRRQNRTVRARRPGNSAQFPDGQEDYPVSGVSWYEAAAYAEYAGKSLPTVYHWRWAAGDHFIAGYLDSGYIVPLSNFEQKGSDAGGRNAGDVAGRRIRSGRKRQGMVLRTRPPTGNEANVGGGWDEPNYMFGESRPVSRLVPLSRISDSAA